MALILIVVFIFNTFIYIWFPLPTSKVDNYSHLKPITKRFSSNIHLNTCFGVRYSHFPRGTYLSIGTSRFCFLSLLSNPWSSNIFSNIYRAVPNFVVLRNVDLVLGTSRFAAYLYHLNHFLQIFSQTPTELFETSIFYETQIYLSGRSYFAPVLWQALIWTLYKVHLFLLPPVEVVQWSDVIRTNTWQCSIGKMEFCHSARTSWN